MKTLLMSQQYRAELPGWTLRGVLSAASSAFWAMIIGFRSPGEIAGMIVGVMFWVAVFAGGCVWIRRRSGLNQTLLVIALKRAVWIKIGLTVVGWLAMFGARALRLSEGSEFGIVWGMDMWLGVIALRFVAAVSGINTPDEIASVDSFGWTALTTATEGSLMALLIVALTVFVCAFGLLRNAFQKRCTGSNHW